MAAAENKRAGAVERVCQGKPLHLGKAGQKRQADQQQEKQRETGGAVAPGDRKGEVRGVCEILASARKKACKCTKSDRRNLPGGTGRSNHDDHRTKCNPRARPVGCQRSGRAPYNLRDNGNGDHLQPVQQAWAEAAGPQPLQVGCQIHPVAIERFSRLVCRGTSR
jgi:hypothetical protein